MQQQLQQEGEWWRETELEPHSSRNESLEPGEANVGGPEETGAGLREATMQPLPQRRDWASSPAAICGYGAQCPGKLSMPDHWPLSG